jgi:methyl-accepting chemotaxis protein
MTSANSSRDGQAAPFVTLNEGNYKAFPKVRSLIEKVGGKALQKLYARIASNRDASSYFSSAEQRSRATQAQLDHWKQLFSGSFDHNQVERSEKIGRVHARIGLTPHYYIGGYAVVLEDIIQKACTRGIHTRLSGAALGNLVGTLVKAALLDMDSALAAYFKAEEEARQVAIDALGEAMAEMADGNMRAELKDLPDAYKQVAVDFARMRHGMSNVLLEMADSSHNIQTGASEISSAADDLANRTERTAESITRTAEVMRKVTSGVLETASYIREVNSSITEVSEQAEEGGSIVTNAISAMDKIKTSSEEIAQITEVIESIAFQTNLLALNAGVEAARAGEAGKGFAVVASEVGALAHRTTESAKSIKALIGKSSADVREGVELVGRTRTALEQIISNVGGAKQQAGEINAQAESHSVQLKHVSEEIQRMDATTQQNAAMVEESNAASQALTHESDRLTTIVSRFSLERRSEARAFSKGPSRTPYESFSDTPRRMAGGR